VSSTGARESARQTVYDTVVMESVVETDDTRTLWLDAGPGPLQWRAGQYVSIDPHQFPGLRSFVGYLEHRKGRREAPRAYSMSSSPHEPHLGITIKEEVFERDKSEYPPLLSGYLVHQVRAGDRIAVRGFAGAYVLPEDVESRTDHILHLCAGSGSVPNVSMIKDSLRRHRFLRHTFVYSNKTWPDVIFRNLLTQLSAEHPDRLVVHHALTRETGALPQVPNVRRGRVDAEFLQPLLAAAPRSLVYACGPAVTVWERRACAARGTTPSPQFLESMLSHLQALAVPRHHIHIEAFG
jgi:ferredoxin-NADP reductase